jgi:CubicO group peptidase (beta-lactamase class C family)
MRTRRALAMLGVACLGPAIGAQPVDPARTAAPPAISWPGATWPVSSPDAEGVDAAAIEALIADIDAGQYGLIDHFLLIRHGRVIADRHFGHDYQEISQPYHPKDEPYDYDNPALHPYYRGTNLHTLQSVTKSINALALGIAIDEGHIPDGVATPAMSFFEAYEPNMSDPRLRSMTLEDMLTMRSGIDWNEMVSYDSDENSCIQLEASDDWIQFMIDRPMREEPGTRFDYNSGVSVLLGKVVGVATGQRVDAYANEKLFKPIGISESYWKTTPDGEVDTEGGLYLSAHDLARIGYLMLRGGRWDGEQIVSEAWVKASTRPVVADVRPGDGRDGPGYGYQWWVPDQENGEATVFAGNGYGGQFVLVAPEYDIVAVFNGWNIHGGVRKFSYVALQRRILPATRK